ncbi:MAG: endonuclease/exonuclease/phosphatase family protein [Acidobacteriota bacterium]
MCVTPNDQLDWQDAIGRRPTDVPRKNPQQKDSLPQPRALFRASSACKILCGWIVLSLLMANVSVAQPSHEFNFGVVNTFLRSTGMYCLQTLDNFPDCMLEYDEVPKANAKKIAAALLFQDLDVIVLNEVFDEDARTELITLLRQEYPHFVAKIDDELMIINEGSGEEEDEFKINGEDSGLMVFSRFEFEPLPNEEFKWDPAFLEGTTEEVAFIRYREFTGHDMLAAKGVGLVRVKDSANDQVYAIVFTHMQADSEDEVFPGIRESQFDDVEKLITTTLGLSPLDHIFLAGDLNVRGEGAIIDGTNISGGDEWQQRFGSGFFNETLIDAWAATTSMEDLGITTYGKIDELNDEKRLDYIVPDTASLTEGWCVQHMRRLALGPTDHLMVQADYNLENPLCDPRRAWHNPPLDQLVQAQSGTTDITEVAHPGGAQWFFYDLTGGPGSADENVTVSIGVPLSDQYDENAASGVVYELYDPRDLSTPIPQYRKEETDLSLILDDTVQNLTGIVHIVPKRFYLKVFSPEPTWTGDYTFLVHQHTCTSPEDRCVLSANESPRRVATFDPYAYVGQDDTMWFQIDVVETPSSGGTQVVRAFAGPYTHDNFRIELVDAEDTEEPVLFPPLTQDLPTFKEFEGEIFGTQSMFLVVQRDDATLGDALEVGWDTNLTILHGTSGFSGGECAGADFWRAELFCEDETNPELGSDEINLLVSVDNGLWIELGVFPFECNDGDVTQVIETQLDGWAFVDNIRFKLIEEDGPINPDDVGPVATIPTLPPNETVRARQHIFWKFEGGHYLMKFNLSRCAM